jgi:hypothetical protein
MKNVYNMFIATDCAARNDPLAETFRLVSDIVVATQGIALTITPEFRQSSVFGRLRKIP